MSIYAYTNHDCWWRSTVIVVVWWLRKDSAEKIIYCRGRTLRDLQSDFVTGANIGWSIIDGPEMSSKWRAGSHFFHCLAATWSETGIGGGGEIGRYQYLTIKHGDLPSAMESFSVWLNCMYELRCKNKNSIGIKEDQLSISISYKHAAHIYLWRS